MKHLLLLLTTFMLFSCNTTQNPFFEDWNKQTPFGVPPFEKIKPEHYMPAFEAGIKEQMADFEAIINNSEEPTFENTIAAYEVSGQLLAKVSRVFFNVNESTTSDEMQEIAKKVTPMLSEAMDNISLNEKFFNRVKAIYDQKDQLGLTMEQMSVLKKHYESLVNSGANLDEAGKAKLRELNKNIGMLELQFGENLLNETNDFKLIVEKEEDLAGLPTGVIDAAQEEAKSMGLENKWVFTLQRPSWTPFMQYAANRDLRKKMFDAYKMRGNNDNQYDNKKVIIDLMKLKIERANILGYKTPADMILTNTMAKDAKTVEDFLMTIYKPAVAKAQSEVKEMQKIVDQEKGNFKIEAHDWFYYAEKVRNAKYNLNEDELKPYFKMENVRQGVFDLASTLWGLKFVKLENMPIYHEDVEVFEVLDADGSHLATFYTDYYPRASKRGGAWMDCIRESYWINGEEIRPVIVNVGNFTKPTATQPSLLTLDEVETLFHEFGHGLHGILAKSKYVSVSGTNVLRDFVELPSQIMENWALEPAVLATYAFHYQTGEVIPDSLIEKINNSSKFNQGFMTTELSAAALLDIKWHNLTSVENIDVVKFEAEAMKNIGLICEIIPRYRSTYFNHIFKGGYSAGYYSYLWAEVLDKDAYELFKQKGIFDKETAESFRRNILEKGSSDEPMNLYLNFRGAKPDPNALLEARGLK